MLKAGAHRFLRLHQPAVDDITLPLSAGTSWPRLAPTSSERSWRPLTLDGAGWNVLYPISCQLRLIHSRSIDHSIVNLKCPCFLFRYPNFDIPSQALFNLHRASALPLGCGIADDQKFQKHSRPLEPARQTAPIHYGLSLPGCVGSAPCRSLLASPSRAGTGRRPVLRTSGSWWIWRQP